MGAIDAFCTAARHGSTVAIATTADLPRVPAPTGTDAGNYVVVQPTGLTADIAARSLTVTGLTPAKTYDRSVSASLSFSLAF